LNVKEKKTKKRTEGIDHYHYHHNHHQHQ